MMKNITTKVLYVVMFCTAFYSSVQAQYIIIEPSDPSSIPAESLEEGLIYYDQDTKALRKRTGNQWLNIGQEMMTKNEIFALPPYQNMTVYNIEQGVVQQWDAGNGWVQKSQDIVIVQNSESEIPFENVFEGMLVFNRAEKRLKVFQYQPDQSGSQWQSFIGEDNLGNHTATQNINVNDKWITPDTTATGEPPMGGIYIASNGLIGIGQGFGSALPANRTAPPSGRNTPPHNNAGTQSNRTQAPSSNNANSNSTDRQNRATASNPQPQRKQNVRQNDVLLENIADGIIMRDQLTGQLRRVVLRGGVLIVE